MAAEFKPGVLTTKGLALLAKWQQGRCTPEITRAEIGKGSYSASESLVNRVSLKIPKFSVQITSKQIKDSQNVILKCTYNNTPISTGFKITEIGIFANDPDEGEILYSMAVVADPNNADFFPAYNGSYPTIVVFYYQIKVSNATDVTIVTPVGSYALAADLLDLDDRLSQNAIADMQLRTVFDMYLTISQAEIRDHETRIAALESAAVSASVSASSPAEETESTPVSESEPASADGEEENE